MAEKETRRTDERTAELKTDLGKMEEEVRDLRRRLEGNLTLPVFGKIAMGFLGVLLSLWSLVWFGLRVYIRNEFLERQETEKVRYYDLRGEQQLLRHRLENVEEQIKK